MRNIHIDAAGRNRIVAAALGVALAAGPATILPATALAAPAAQAATASTTAAKGLNAEEQAFIGKYKSTIASALGIDGFDPSTGDYYGVKESALDTVAGRIPTANAGLTLLGAPLEIDTTATGWLVDGKTTPSKPSTGDLAYRITIKGKSGGAATYTLHTAAKPAGKPDNGVDTGELAGVTATADGKPVRWFDPTTSGTWTVPAGAEVTIGNVPDGWKLDRTTSKSKLTFTVSKDVLSVTWTFAPGTATDPGKPSVKDFTDDELAEIRAAFAGFDAEYHSGAFDPASTGYQVDDVKALLDVSVAGGAHTNVTAGSYDEHGMPTEDAAKVKTRTYTVSGKESFVTRTYRFETRQPEAAFTDAELKDIESLFSDDFKIPGFDPAITAYQMDDVDSLPLFWTDKPHIDVILTGLDGIGKPCYTPVENGTYVYTVTGKDSGSTRTYMVDQKPGTPAAPTTPSASDLSGVTATADGKPVKGFDPVAGGSWTVPAGAEVTIGNVPAGWTLDRKTTDGKLTFTVRNAPVAVVYTFIHQGEDSSTTQPTPSKPGAPEGTGDASGKTPGTTNPAVSPNTANDGKTTGTNPLASTGAGTGPAVAVAGLLAMAGASLLAAVARTRRRHGADPDGPMSD